MRKIAKMYVRNVRTENRVFRIMEIKILCFFFNN